MTADVRDRLRKLTEAREKATPGPVRIQRKRTKGWRMPAGAKYVGRPTRWGNPVEVRRVDCSGGGMCWSLYADDGSLITEHIDRPDEASRQAVELYLQWLDDYHELRDAIRRELVGRDLACWCPLDQPCHADVLLEVANRAVVAAAGDQP